jgi:hypothetical protein
MSEQDIIDGLIARINDEHTPSVECEHCRHEIKTMLVLKIHKHRSSWCPGSGANVSGAIRSDSVVAEGVTAGETAPQEIERIRESAGRTIGSLRNQIDELKRDNLGLREQLNTLIEGRVDAALERGAEHFPKVEGQ